MKKLFVSLLIILCLLSASAFGEGGIKLISIREWIDMKGNCGDCYLIAIVTKINNPMLASICDDTASVNLFTVIEENGICEKDILIIHSPEYNEYEGTVEMAFPEIVRRIHIDENGMHRENALSYSFVTSPDEQIYISNQIFDGEVTISGNGQAINFSNCEFKENIVNLCSSDTAITILPDCEFAEGAHCVLQSGMHEANMEYPFPKFVLTFPVEVECTDLGGVIATGDFDIVFNGQTYSIHDAAHLKTANGSIIENDGSANTSALCIGQWWENGEKTLFTMGIE